MTQDEFIEKMNALGFGVSSELNSDYNFSVGISKINI